MHCGPKKKKNQIIQEKRSLNTWSKINVYMIVIDRTK